jgi:hypothetical protein
MSFFPLCPDPLLKLVWKTYQAMPIRIPGGQYTPLGLIAKRGSHEKFLGTVTNFLTDTSPFDKRILERPLASVSASRSNRIDFKIGFSILNGFLQGMGLDGAALKTKFSGVRKVSFSFQNVHMKWLDLGLLGSFLKEKKIDLHNPASNLFLEEKAACLLIDSTIVSDNFSLHVEEASSTDFKLDIPSIQDVVGKLKSDVSVASSGDLHISFSKKPALAFAFTSITLTLDVSGGIRFSAGDFEAHAGTAERSNNAADAHSRIVLYDGDGMVAFD